MPPRRSPGSAPARRRSGTRTRSSRDCATCCVNVLPTCWTPCWLRARSRSRSWRTCRRRSRIDRPGPATTSWSRSRAGARRSSGYCGGSCSPSPVSNYATVSRRRASTAPGARATGIDGVAADLVVDARGPRSSSDPWLESIGAPPVVEELHESGIVYFSRFYEMRPGVEAPAYVGPTAADLGYVKYAIFLGDNDTFSITYRDRERRRRAAQAAVASRTRSRSLRARSSRPRRGAPTASPTRSPTST